MPTRWRAPGRVNLLGEHTDYNEGFALPFAIEQGCTATVRERADDRIVVRSAQRADTVDVPLGDLTPDVGGWAAYVLGAPWVLRRGGHRMPGLTIDIDSDVPIGSGLSSSAAVVCSVVTALDDLLGLGMDGAALLAATRSVENDFVGAPTGGLDQLIALRAQAGHALLCDMRSLATEAIPFRPRDAGLTIVVIDTRAAHGHSGGEYGKRRAGCERAADELGVAALRDIGPDDLTAALGRLTDDELRRYVRHVVTENERVLAVVDLLRADRLPDIGPLLTESHASMRDDYRITVDEVDCAVAALLDAGALGARMTGGGFGGSVIGLIDAARAGAAVDAVREAFTRQGYDDPRTFRVDRPAAGARLC